MPSIAAAHGAQRAQTEHPQHPGQSHSPPCKLQRRGEGRALYTAIPQGRLSDTPLFLVHQIIEYPELEGTHKDHQRPAPD